MVSPMESTEETPAWTGGGKLLPAIRDLKPNGRLVRRFWSKTTRRAVNSRKRDCWEWQGSKDEKGYGHYWLPGVGNVAAHRVALALALGRWSPSSLMVLHSCDNPSCVNPAHLREGTAAENQEDILKRGRHASQRDGRQPEPRKWRRPGTDHWRPGPPNERILRGGSKLEAYQVRAVRAAVDELGEEPVPFDRECVVGSLALEYGVSITTIDRIARRVTFSWLV